PLRRLLNNSGYWNVSFTDDLNGAICLHRKFHYDLLLLNFQNTGMNEADLIEGLQKIDMEDSLPVLVIAGKSTDTLHALPAGIRDFVREPFDMLEIKTRIHNMLVMHFLDKKIENYKSAAEAIIQERTAELKEREASFRRLVELSSDWYWEQDRDGKFTKISGPVLEMLGLKEHCTNDEHNAHRFHWNQIEREMLDSNLAERRPFLDFAYSLIRPDGSHQYLRVSGEPAFDAAGRFSGYRGVGVDVSEYMQMEERLARFRKISEDAGDAILFLDSTNMHLLDANDAALKLWGYTREELLDFNFENIIDCCQSSRHRTAHYFMVGHSVQKKIDAIGIKHKNGTLLSGEMLSQHSSRKDETNMLILFVHMI
ncbi:MAG TPA: PAS domain S-box protein, partial [Burkholderiaceae bacterium]